MGITFAATSKAAGAPDIEAGVYDARFEGVTSKFITGGQYGDGNRFEWAFTLLDDEGAVLYDAGDPVEITQLTSESVNVASKTQPRAVRNLKAIMTASEFAQFESGDGIPADELVGRKVQVEVVIKDSGWPSVANVLPARKSRSSKAE